ncbi:CsxC family protein [Virgibacillus flavescens]|uniref:CsxC family protein n=1 Tax=Virgibacillus flavescens TaxID=1611422 RepID=UPI003D3397DD
MNNKEKCVNLNQSASVDSCTNTPTDTPVTPLGERLIRVPVNLGDFIINSSLVANITFPHPVLEIKDIKKRVEIVQCRLLTPSAAAASTFDDGPFPLYIKGFVRKNIQYASPSPCDNASGSCVSSEIRSLTARVPFECMTTVTLDSPALLPVRTTRNEFDFYRAQELGSGFPEKDQYQSSDISQFHQQSTQAYNDLPFCELVSSSILEWDEATDRQSFGDGPEDEGYFHHIVEKMNLNFTVRVLQTQQVRIDAL